MSVGQSTSSTVTTTVGATSSQTHGVADTIHKRPLAAPDEIGRLFGDRNKPAALAIISGLQPLILKRTSYFEDRLFAGLFDAHRDHAPPETLASRQERLRLLSVRAAEEQARRQLAREKQQKRAQWLASISAENKRDLAILIERNKKKAEIQARKRRKVQFMLWGSIYSATALFGAIVMGWMLQ
jgi:hypothetical protein